MTGRHARDVQYSNFYRPYNNTTNAMLALTHGCRCDFLNLCSALSSR